MGAHDGSFQPSDSLQKIERLAQLREETQTLERELEEAAVRQQKQLQVLKQSAPGTPRQSASRISRRPVTSDAINKESPPVMKADPAKTNTTILSMREKVLANYNSLQLALHRADRNREKLVSKEDFIGTLNRCNVPTSKGMADEIFGLLGMDHLGRIDYGEFLSKFTGPPPDAAMQSGYWSDRKPKPTNLSKQEGLEFERPATGSQRPVTGRSMLSSRAGRPATQAGPKPPAWGDGTVTLMSEVHEYVRLYRKKFDELFDVADIQSTGAVSKMQCQRIFQWVGLPMTLPQVDEMLTSVGEPTSSKTIRYGPLLNKLAELSMDRPDVFDHISSVHFAPSHLLEIIRRRVKLKYKGCLWLLREDDTEGTGEISRTALLRILKGINLEISETQLEEVLTQMGLWPNYSQSGTINVHLFLQQCVKDHVIPPESEFLERSIASKIPKEIASAPKMSVGELLNMLQQKMELSIKYPRDMFLKLDTDKDGFITKSDLAKAFTLFNLFPTPKEVDEFFKVVDEDKTGLIGFQLFLKKLAPRKGYKFMNEPATDAYFNYIPTGTLSPIPRASTGGQLQPADHATIIRKQVRPNHQLVSLMLKEKDTDNTGVIARKHLLQVLHKVDVFLNLNQMNQALAAMGLEPGPSIGIGAFLDAVGTPSARLPTDDLREGLSRRATAGVRYLPERSLQTSRGRGPPLPKSMPEAGARRGGATHRGRLETYSAEARQEEAAERAERRLRAKWGAVNKAFAALEVAALGGRSVGKQLFVASLQDADPTITPKQAMAIAAALDYEQGPESIGIAQLAEILGLSRHPHPPAPRAAPPKRPAPAPTLSAPDSLSVDRLSLPSSRGATAGAGGQRKLKALLASR